MLEFKVSNSPMVINQKDTNMNTGLEKRKIVILLCIPPNVIKQISATDTSPISCLQKFLPSAENYDLFCDGIVLEKSRSFKYYNIRDNTQIIGYPKTPNEVNHQFYKWLRMSKDTDFQEKISLVIKKDTKRESARLSDLNLYKIEGNKKFYQKYMRKNLDLFEEQKFSNENTVIPNEKPTGPIEEPLNLFMYNDDGKHFNGVKASFQTDSTNKISQSAMDKICI